MEVDRRVVLYPAYIDKAKTVQEGRRICKEKAVQEPHAYDIRYCVEHGLKLPCELEPGKAYSRDWMRRGRVRVTLRKPDGSLVQDGIPNRKALYTQVAEFLLRMPENKKFAFIRAAKIAEIKAAQAQSSGQSAGGASKSSKSGKKKKKK